MMYQDKFVATLKINGQAVREREPGCFYIPFGSEYELYLKNLSSRRASAGVEVDGADVLEGTQIVLDPNESIDLKGFMRNNAVRKRFKFIQETEKTREHRGSKPEDGLVRIEYAFERYQPFTITYTGILKDYSPPTWNSTSTKGSTSPKGVLRSCTLGANTTATSCFNVSTGDSTQGFTAAGSDCYQGFTTTTLGEMEPPQSMVLRIFGAVGEKPVQRVVATRKRVQCPSCGTRSRSFSKFCPECGTALDW